MVTQSMPTYAEMLERDIGGLHRQLAAVRGELRDSIAARNRAWALATSCLPFVDLFRMLIERDLIDREFMEMMMPHSDDLLATFATLQPGDAEPEGGENPHG